MDGVGIEHNYKKAQYYFERIADKNHPLGLYNLAVMYKNALGVEQDLNRAIKYWKAARQHGLYTKKWLVEELP